MTLERVSKAILDRARAEAEEILERARKEAEEIINKAKLRRRQEQEREEARIISEAKRKARAIIVKAMLKARKDQSEVKRKIIDEIIERVKEEIKRKSFNYRESLKNLIQEAVKTLPPTDIIICANKGDLKEIREVLRELKLTSKVKDIREANISGGVIVETIDGKFRIDNSYETRLEMALSRLLPEISRELFGE